MNLNQESKIFHHDRQRFDEVKVTTIPRYKQSGLSGDEWRFCASINFLYKGEVIWSHSFCDCETAMQVALTCFTLDCESMKVNCETKDKCDQEGCKEKATVKAFIKKKYCVGGGNCGSELKKYNRDYLQFCEKHSTRGDCDLQDCDDNYNKELI